MAENEDESYAKEDYSTIVPVILDYEKTYRNWTTRSDDVVSRYRDENQDDVNASTSRSHSPTHNFNIFWSNVQTIIPTVFSQLPKASVTRKFNDRNNVGRVASIILERALEYEMESFKDYGASLKKAILDRFLGGRGTVWVRYEADTEQVEIPQMPNVSWNEKNEMITEDVEPLIHEKINSEYSPVTRS